MKQACQLIRKSQRVLLCGHLRADGDSLGSAIVLARALRAIGKEVHLIMPDPPDPRYQFLFERTQWSLYQGEDSLPEVDLVIVCDCSQLDRLGLMGEEVECRGFKRMMVDHHPYDPEVHFWHAAVHDTTAAATGILAFELAQELGAPVDEISSEASFVALMTDTGWLKYSNADARAFQCAASLVAGGVDADRVYRMIYQQTSAATPKGMTAALATTEYHENQTIAIGHLTPENLHAVGGELEETDDVLDILRAVQSVEVVAFLSLRGSRVKVSFRSKTWLDVNQVARQCGGGGHQRAAGATFAEGVSMEEALEVVRANLINATKLAPLSGQDED
ncbi:MAG: DHH family phosphoesterase [Planctomycetes bacterium]|nr:DHH family phosphoesterase [Planctomycetota bacterium]